VRRRIPNTGSLLAFEAAARHGSFSRAAEELHLTEGAVSRQIARLEEFLGVPLFTRIKNRVHLTAAARLYWEQVAANLARIEQDTLSLTGRPEGGVLELAVIPTFTNHWIMPRLPRFLEKNPGITINMTERPEPFLFADSDFDAAIAYDHPAWTGMIKRMLFAEELVAICAPALLPAGRKPQPEDLARLPLLHKRGRADEWKKWWDAVGEECANPMAGPRYDLFSMVIEAARAGLGLALVPKLYVAGELARGEFVIPLEAHGPGDKSYCVVYPERKHDQWPLNVFIAWLDAETKRYLDERSAAQVEARRRPGTTRKKRA
jgi:DNA-binding transcriptional LysR family regulator